MKNDPIVTVVMDSHHCVGLTESDLDEWFRSLPVQQKVLVYEDRMEQDVQPHQLREGDRLNLKIGGNTLEDVIQRGDQVLSVMRQIAAQPINC